jgi:hypothetical protein
MSLRRTFGLFSEHSQLSLEADLYNATNHTQFLVGAPFLAAPASAPSAARRIARAMLSCHCD